MSEISIHGGLVDDPLRVGPLETLCCQMVDLLDEVAEEPGNTDRGDFAYMRRLGGFPDLSGNTYVEMEIARIGLVHEFSFGIEELVRKGQKGKRVWHRLIPSQPEKAVTKVQKFIKDADGNKQYSRRIKTKAGEIDELSLARAAIAIGDIYRRHEQDG